MHGSSVNEGQCSAFTQLACKRSVNCNCGLPEGWSRDRVDQHIKSLIKKVTKDKVKDEMTSPTEETKVVMKWWGSICTCDPKTLEDPPGNSPSGIRYLGRSYQILLLILAHYTHVRVTSYICFCAGEEDDEQEEKKSKRKAKILDDPSGNSPSGIRYLHTCQSNFLHLFLCSRRGQRTARRRDGEYDEKQEGQGWQQGQ
jgi:hypothetical protein